MATLAPRKELRELRVPIKSLEQQERLLEMELKRIQHIQFHQQDVDELNQEFLTALSE